MVWAGQSSEHDADHGEAEEGGDGSGVAFEVAGQTAVAADPGKGALDDPTLGQSDKPMSIAALDDLQGPRAGLSDELGALRPLIADSDDVARSFRDHVARCSDMMSPA